MENPKAITIDIGHAIASLNASPELADAMNKAMGLSERYRLAQDNDSHWYVIPLASEGDWNDWLDGADDESDPPDFAMPVGGSYSLVSFCNPGLTS